MENTVYILDDEEDILSLVSLNLKKSGFHPVAFDNARDFHKALQSNIPALIILDLMLPNTDGMEICKTLRKDERLASVPIIMLTAREDEMDRVLGLELGADDYVTKPFSPRELVARIKAVLRRAKPATKSTRKLTAGILTMDFNTYEVWVKDEKVGLTSTEFRLLKLLVERKGWVFSREQILDYLWGKEKIVIDRTVDVHIKNLREKLLEAGDYIKNVRGVGYKIEI